MTLEGKLIVSCQADKGDAFYGLMDRYALAALAGGAGGIRANGPADIAAIKKVVDLPIIGIQKELHPDGRILITPTFEGAQALVEAGASMVALDCTKRGQKYGALERLQKIKTDLRIPVLADIATIEEAEEAVQAGADFVLSTMRGYTDDTQHATRFDPGFIRELVRVVNVPVIAEGRIDNPEFAAEAMRAGAYCVVVGTAITRPHSVVRTFVDAIQREFVSQKQVRWTLGIDMGGTNTKFGLVSNCGELLWEDTLPTPAHSGRDGLLEHLKQVAITSLERAKRSHHHVSAIGIATAGWVNPATGAVVYATENLPGWTGTQISGVIREATGKPVFIENDANALAVGEKVFGVARNFQDFVCITLGTGVGGGCYVGGRLNHGAHCFANAFGHMSIEPQGLPCSCGKRGCLEMYTNTAALLRSADSQYPDARLLIQAANEGETIAVSALQNFAQYLAKGCSLLIQLLDPEALILAGGLAENNPLLLSYLASELAELVPVWEQRNLQLLTSSAGYHAGVLGAAALERQ